ncbi:MAG: class II aldolase/adducin family protein [Clostridia bacterium]|nr:class II aldolase/adducin family protein [Clostridia bacterium]
MDYPDRAQVSADILEIGRRLEAHGYVVANDGNISCLIGPDRVLSTPTGVSKGRMQEDMLVETDLEGSVIRAGTKAPSSEIRMHLRVYQENPELGAVVHAHPVTATCFAAAGICLDEPILTEAVTAVGSIPVARFAVPGTREVPDSVAPFCRQYNGALLANHGVITWAPQLELAFFRMEWVEMYAQATLITRYLMGRSNWLSGTETQPIEEIRRRMGIRLGGEPVYAADSPNVEDVLPRAGLVTPEAADPRTQALLDGVEKLLRQSEERLERLSARIARQAAAQAADMLRRERGAADGGEIR